MDLPAAFGPERLRRYPVIVAVVAAVAWAGWLLATRDGLDPAERPLGADYLAFHAAGTLVVEGRAADVYDAAELHARVKTLVPRTEAVLPIHYPPPALLAFAIPARLPYAAGFGLWTLGSLGALAALFTLLRSGPLGWRWGYAFPGALLVLFNGQTSAWVALAVCGGVALVGTDALAGGLLVGLAVVKPNYLLLPLVAFVVAGQGRALVGTALSAGGLCLLSVALLGWAPWSAWLDHLPEVGVLLASDRLQLAKMPTVTASLTQWGAPSMVVSGLQGFAGGLALWAVAIAARRKDLDRILVAVAFGSFLLTPFAFDYDLVVTWTGLYVLARRWTVEAPGSVLRWSLLAAGFVLPLALQPMAAVHLPLGPLLLGVLLFHGLSRSVDPPPTG